MRPSSGNANALDCPDARLADRLDQRMTGSARRAALAVGLLLRGLESLPVEFGECV
jgi:hypothetical protein